MTLRAGRAGRVLAGLLVGGYVVAGLIASHRAYFPVGRVTIVTPSALLQPETVVSVETTTSGRGPVSILVELVQEGRSETIAADRIPSKPWAYWDPRRVHHTTQAVLPSGLKGRFHDGEVTLRATVTGVPAWLRQPPPVVAEVRLPLELGRAGS